MQEALPGKGPDAETRQKGAPEQELLMKSDDDDQATAERCPLHRDSAEILRFAAETCLLMSTTNRFISPSHGETVNGNTLSGQEV